MGSSNSIGLMWWMLAREVLRLRGSISRDTPWEVMPDLFFYRDPEEVEREEAAKEAEIVASKQQDFAAPPSKEEWGGDQQGPAADYESMVNAAGAPVVPAPAAVPAYQVTEDWAAASEPVDWAAQSAPAAGDRGQPAATWGGSSWD